MEKVANNVEPPKVIEDLLKVVVGSWSDFFTVLLVIGVLSMAVIQIVKDVIPARRYYQLGWLRRWVARKLGVSSSDAASQTILQRLVDLATAGDRVALGDLEPEQIGAQLNAAGRLMLDEPHRHSEPLRVLAAPGAKAAGLNKDEDPDLVYLIEFAAQHEKIGLSNSHPKRASA